MYTPTSTTPGSPGTNDALMASSMSCRERGRERERERERERDEGEGDERVGYALRDRARAYIQYLAARGIHRKHPRGAPQVHTRARRVDDAWAQRAARGAGGRRQGVRGNGPAAAPPRRLPDASFSPTAAASVVRDGAVGYGGEACERRRGEGPGLHLVAQQQAVHLHGVWVCVWVCVCVCVCAHTREWGGGQRDESVPVW